MRNFDNFSKFGLTVMSPYECALYLPDLLFPARDTECDPCWGWFWVWDRDYTYRIVKLYSMSDLPKYVVSWLFLVQIIMFQIYIRGLTKYIDAWVYNFLHKAGYSMYRSLAKKDPVSNIRPPPIIASIFCKGLKFTPKSAHPIDLVRKVFECNMMQG